MAINNINLDDYAQYFNDNKLWKKLKKVARKAGRKAVYYILVLYYVSRDPAVPRSLKLKVLGALGYFILPLDIIPDFILGLGFTDDLAALNGKLAESFFDLHQRREARHFENIPYLRLRADDPEAGVCPADAKDHTKARA